MAERPDEMDVHVADKEEISPCDDIDEFNLKRALKPTREDVRDLLEKQEGNIFLLNFHFTALPLSQKELQARKISTKKKGSTKKKIKYDKIISILWEKYRLYKLRSTKGKKHTANPQMYLGLIRNGGENDKKLKIKQIIEDAKGLIVAEEFNVKSVHVVASQAIIYDVPDEEEEEEEEQGEGEEQREEEGEEGNKETLDKKQEEAEETMDQN